MFIKLTFHKENFVVAHCGGGSVVTLEEKPIIVESLPEGESARWRFSDIPESDFVYSVEQAQKNYQENEYAFNVASLLKDAKEENSSSTSVCYYDCGELDKSTIEKGLKFYNANYQGKRPASFSEIHLIYNLTVALKNVIQNSASKPLAVYIDDDEDKINWSPSAPNSPLTSPTYGKFSLFSQSLEDKDDEENENYMKQVVTIIS